MDMSATMADFDLETHVEHMRLHGYTIVENILDADGLAAFRAGLEPHFGSHRGRNAFEGRTTERVYTLVARGKALYVPSSDSEELRASLLVEAVETRRFWR